MESAAAKLYCPPTRAGGGEDVTRDMRSSVLGIHAEVQIVHLKRRSVGSKLKIMSRFILISPKSSGLCYCGWNGMWIGRKGALSSHAFRLNDANGSKVVGKAEQGQDSVEALLLSNPQYYFSFENSEAGA
ncbi:hypothetical protein NM208_g12222 [Fusarium decemcellulare]|uniref:Uncharacterized protein n=1 Tax=Fusarium decemcellulare TaxID=57161 RepID=A0ACC1RQP4_9HYPO|nr:hypothetical protein NM208_g12222 [Fusarium decemcellulare]